MSLVITLCYIPIHSLHKYLLSAYNEPGTVLGVWDTAVNKSDKNPCSQKTFIWPGIYCYLSLHSAVVKTVSRKAFLLNIQGKYVNLGRGMSVVATHAFLKSSQGAKKVPAELEHEVGVCSINFFWRQKNPPILIPVWTQPHVEIRRVGL